MSYLKTMISSKFINGHQFDQLKLQLGWCSSLTLISETCRLFVVSKPAKTKQYFRNCDVYIASHCKMDGLVSIQKRILESVCWFIFTAFFQPVQTKIVSGWVTLRFRSPKTCVFNTTEFNILMFTNDEKLPQKSGIHRWSSQQHK